MKLIIRPHPHRELIKSPEEIQLGWEVHGRFYKFASYKNSDKLEEVLKELRDRNGEFEIEYG